MTYALTQTISAILGQPINERRKDALVRCPFHDDRHASLSVNLENGFWVCFACGLRGGLRSLATRLNVEIDDADIALKVYEASESYVYEEPKDFAVLAKTLHQNLYSTKPEAILDFIGQRNLLPDVVRHFRLGWDGYRISFPYYDDEAVIGVRYRDKDGNKSYESGSARGLYNVNDIRMRPYVFICEGESDTLAVWSDLTRKLDPVTMQNIGICGVPGVAANKSTWDLWALDLLWAKRVYVLYDADEAGDEGARLPLAAVGDKGVRIRPTLGKDMSDHILAGGTILDFAVGDATNQPD